jgi:electron transfer flavoprotein alpha subunit/NAD-dependent dihydropyrimidine dehydrogenase PreA subunit
LASEGPIRLDRGRCTGCGVCASVCPFGAIEIVEGYPVIGEGCRLCASCVEACPSKALTIRESERVEDLSSYRGVLIYAEQRRGRIHPVSFELLGKGRELADKLGEPLSSVIIGSGIAEAAGELIARGADTVYVYDDPILADFRDDPYSAILVDLVREVKPSIFLFGATSIGRSLAPRVAASLNTGLTADCTGLDIDPETRLLVQTRPAFGGNVMATIVCPNRRPQMATVRYKVMPEAPRDPSRGGEIRLMKLDAASLPDRVRILQFQPLREEVSITEADVVVSGGKGLGNPEGFKLLGELAELLGGAVGASRPTVDEGWIGYSHQVGLSGRTVRPKLYIACGISGAVQHLAGMRTSDFIVAINKDREAPIFSVASLGVVGDLYEVIPRLIERIKEYRGHGSVRPRNS